jgi:polar amino acid transport system substrate-binding protein
VIDLLSCNLYTLYCVLHRIYDSPNLLLYENREGQGKVTVVGKIFEPQDYGLALPQSSPLRKKINRVILKLMENDEFERTVKNWLGGKE